MYAELVLLKHISKFMMLSIQETFNLRTCVPTQRAAGLWCRSEIMSTSKIKESVEDVGRDRSLWYTEMRSGQAIGYCLEMIVNVSFPTHPL